MIRLWYFVWNTNNNIYKIDIFGTTELILMTNQIIFQFQYFILNDYCKLEYHDHSVT